MSEPRQGASGFRRPVGRPPGSNGSATRHAILAAAHESFVTIGFEKTSLTAIAETAGLTRGAVYNYFASKDLLARAVLLEYSGDKHVTLMGDRWWRDLPPGLSATEQLQEILKRAVSAAIDLGASPDSNFYLQLVRASRDDASVRRNVTEYVEDQRSMLSGIVSAGIASGEYSADLDPEDIAEGLQGMIWALTTGIVSAPNEKTKQQVVRSLGLLLAPLP